MYYYAFSATGTTVTARKTTPKPRKIPTCRHHKASNQGFVELNGNRFYLGRYDTPEARHKYHRIIAKWLAVGRQLPTKPTTVTVKELLARFWLHARTYYVRADAKATSEINNLKPPLQPVKKLYGEAEAVDFGPLALRIVRQHIVDKGLCRPNINKAIRRLKMVFK